MNEKLRNKSILGTTLVHSLLYPAVLGAMFYNFLPTLFTPEEIANEKLLFISTVLLIVYFCIDYAYTVSFPSYSIVAGVLDAVALIFMYRAEVLLNPMSTDQFTKTPGILLMIIHLLFIGWDVKEKAWEMLCLNIPVTILLAVCVFLYTNLVFFICIQLVMIAIFSTMLSKKISIKNE